MLSLMIYVTAVTLLLALAAFTCERAVRGLLFFTRWIWAAALATSLGFTLLVFPWPGGSSTPVDVVGPDAAGGPVAASLTELTSSFVLPAGLDPYAAAVWGTLSLVVGLVLLCAHVGLSSERSTWTRMKLGDRDILLAENFGPGVVGLVRSAIVMPSWALEMPAPEQELMLQHESEHRAAGDVWLTSSALWLLVMLPWCVPMWWMVRRLRLAIEIDCDHRVLRRSSEVRPYASLLVEIGARRMTSPAGVLAFARPAPFLERRIRAMTDNPDPHYGRALGMTFLAGLLVVTACQMEQLPTTPPQASVVAQDGPYFTPMTVRPEITNRREVIQAMMGAYPQVLRDAGVGGQTLVWFHIDETGRTIESRLSRTSGRDALDDAALEVARVYRFTGALNKDEPVKVWVQIPITFEVR